MTRWTPTRLVAAAAVTFAAVLLATPASGQEEPPPALVVAVPAVSESITETIKLPGTVLPVRDSVVASQVEGLVAERLVENGQRIRRGQTLVRLDSSRLRQDLVVARAQLAEVEAQFELAIRQEDRATELHENRILPQRDLDEAMFSRQALESRRSATEAYIASIEDDIARTEIHAPFSGVVTELHTEVGEWVERGGEVLRLSDLGTLEIRLAAPERYFSMLHTDLPTTVRIDSLPQLELAGRVFSLVPRADTDARTFPLLIRARNPDGRVGAGMLCTVELELTSGEPALLVPKDAIVRQAQREVVFVVEDGTARLVPVKTGRSDGEQVEVIGDLGVGQQVVVRGNERLIPGQPVRLEAAGAAAASD